MQEGKTNTNTTFNICLVLLRASGKHGEKYLTGHFATNFLICNEENFKKTHLHIFDKTQSIYFLISCDFIIFFVIRVFDSRTYDNMESFDSATFEFIYLFYTLYYTLLFE